jgi:hypothetical protein
MNQSVPNPFYFFFLDTLIAGFVGIILALGKGFYGYKFPNKLKVKDRRPKKYLIYSIYSSFACLVIEIFVLLYWIVNFNQIVFGSLGFVLLYLGLAMYPLIILPALILEIMYHLYWKQDFLKSQQEGE